VNARDLQLLRHSLVLVWFATALSSAWEAHGRSAALLHQAGVDESTLAALMLWGGVALDAGVGALLMLAPLRLAATVALAATLAMTVLTSVALPGQWLDPLGSLTKNLPILAVLIVLRRNAS
jgi:hypothetical protein